MDKLTQRDEYGNADIIGIDSQMNAFKELLSQIVRAQTADDFYKACGAVDGAFFQGRISAEDHQLFRQVLDLRGMTIDG